MRAVVHSAAKSGQSPITVEATLERLEPYNEAIAHRNHGCRRSRRLVVRRHPFSQHARQQQPAGEWQKALPAHLLAHVARERDRPTAIEPPASLGRLLGHAALQVGAEHSRALAREELGCRAADAASRARHDGHAPREQAAE